MQILRRGEFLISNCSDNDSPFEKLKEINKKQKEQDKQLGRKHVGGCLAAYIDGNYVEDFSAASKFMHKFVALGEAYRKTKLSEIDWFVLEASHEFEKYEIEDIKNFAYRNFVFVVKGVEQRVSGARYLPKSDVLEFTVNRELVADIKYGRNLGLVIKELKRFLEHEDTHRQQALRSRGLSARAYTRPDEDYHKYVNQKTEVDAYARQFGFELRNLYPEENTDQLLKRIRQLDISDKRLCNDLEFFSFSEEVTEKNRELFFCNLYDYLEGNEEPFKDIYKDWYAKAKNKITASQYEELNTVQKSLYRGCKKLFTKANVSFEDWWSVILKYFDNNPSARTVPPLFYEKTGKHKEKK